MTHFKKSARLVAAVLLLLALTLGAGFALAQDAAAVAQRFGELSGQYGPIHQWSEEDKDSFFTLIDESGCIWSGDFEFGEPGEGDLSEEDAVSAALNTIASLYGVPRDSVAAIKPFTALNVANADMHVWQIDFLPEDVSQAGYTVYLLAQGGDVLLVLSDEDSNG